jgi:hypothetical protein
MGKSLCVLYPALRKRRGSTDDQPNQARMVTDLLEILRVSFISRFFHMLDLGFLKRDMGGNQMRWWKSLPPAFWFLYYNLTYNPPHNSL